MVRLSSTGLRIEYLPAGVMKKELASAGWEVVESGSRYLMMDDLDVPAKIDFYIAKNR